MNIKPFSTALLTATALAASAAHAQVSGFGGFAPANYVASFGSNDTTLNVTNNYGHSEGSAYYATPQNITTGFDASFVFTASGDRNADGFTFVVQNDPHGTKAIGDIGSGLGYASATGGTGILDSAAVEFNFYNGSSTGFGTEGVRNTNDAIGSGINLASGQPVGVNLAYNGSVLDETLTQAGAVYTTRFNTGSLEQYVGAPTAFIGFTGSDGGLASTQTISSFSFRETPAPVPEASTTVSLGLLLALGLGGLVVAARRKKDAASR